MGLDRTKCKHGQTLEEHLHGLYDGYVIAAPWSTCECCLTRFWYIDSSVIGWDGAGEVNKSKGEEWVPLNRCGGCGGHSVKYDHPTVETP